MALNGWRRIWIVLAAGWALVIVGRVALEYYAAQGDGGDGFFTCWQPIGSPTPPSKRFWNRECGLFPRDWVATGFFDDLGPGRRDLNVERFLAVLLGPGLLIGLIATAIRWVMAGFRDARARPDPQAEESIRRAAIPADPPQHALRSAAQTWLYQLPRRWARNAAIGGGALGVLAIMPMLSKGDGTFAALMLVGLAIVTIGISGAGYLCGRWARYSLTAPFALSPASALSRITSNWMIGAILIAMLTFVGGRFLGLLSVNIRFEAGLSAADWGYLTGLFGTWTIGGYIAALVSKRGLRKAIEGDRNLPVVLNDGSSAPHDEPFQREYSIG